MIFIALAYLLAAGCIVACVRRLRFAIAPTILDLAVVAQCIRKGGDSRIRCVAKIRNLASADVERDLADAFELHDGEARAAAVNAVLTEYEFRTARWGSVPRVSARIASSGAFLLAALALLNALTDGAELEGASLFQTVAPSIHAIVLGLGTTFFCVASHIQAKRAAERALQKMDQLVDAFQAPPAYTIPS